MKDIENLIKKSAQVIICRYMVIYILLPVSM